MSDIEKAAETTRGVLYHHFASKDEMILEIISENLGNAATKLETDLVQLQANGQGELEQLMTNMLTLVEQITFGPGKAMSVHVWSLSMLKPEVKKHMEAFFERIRQALQGQLLELRNQGKLDSNANVEHMATVLFSIQIPAYIVQRLFTNSNALGPKEFIAALMGLCHK